MEKVILSPTIQRMAVLFLAFILDMIFGDPRWLLHPVVLIGKLISKTKKVLKKCFHIDSESRYEQKKRKYVAGLFLFLIVVCIATIVPFGILSVLKRYIPIVAFFLEVFWTYQILAAKSLYTESMKVYRALTENLNTEEERLKKGRLAVSMIVGRDTNALSEEGIVKATVETIAENTSDGEVAPFFYMLLFGICGGFFYKAVNTLDSMVGYKNDEYYYLGRVSAKMDDVLNYIPARISGLFMVCAAFFAKADMKHSFQIFCRDRMKHKSPNSAQTESAMAGALHVALAGDAYYFGELHKKDVIGDDDRKIEPNDIKWANQIMMITSSIVWIIGLICLYLYHMIRFT